MAVTTLKGLWPGVVTRLGSAYKTFLSSTKTMSSPWKCRSTPQRRISVASHRSTHLCSSMSSVFCMISAPLLVHRVQEGRHLGQQEEGGLHLQDLRAACSPSTWKHRSNRWPSQYGPTSSLDRRGGQWLHPVSSPQAHVHPQEATPLSHTFCMGRLRL